MTNGNVNLDNSTDIDSEGLQSHYDVILYGTGLIQSILASALARAGKSVLHCDDASYYGQTDAVLTLPYVLRNEDDELWQKKSENDDGETKYDDDGGLRIEKYHTRPTLHSTHKLTEVLMTPGTEVTTPYGSGTILSNTTASSPSLKISLSNWKLADGTSPTLHIGGIPECDKTQRDEYLLTKCQIQPTLIAQTKQLLQHQSRSFALDVTPALIFGAGAAVQGFLQSGVSDYCEFQTVPGILYLSSKGLLDVPCSKGTVFTTKLLGPLEKRQLMKLLQLVMDYGTALETEKGEQEEATGTEEEVVQSINERQLNQGRSLSRPQNKKVVDEMASLKELVQNNTITFAEWCQSRKLSQHLSDLVQHALALTTSSDMSLQEGLTRLAHHVQGLGQFGTTAFLCPLYGSGEFAQAFCRSAAVHGATYLLRRSIQRIQLATPTEENKEEKKKVTGFVLEKSRDDPESTMKTISCTHAILSCGALSSKMKTPKRWLLRRISILSHALLTKADHQRHVIIIPPSQSHPFAIHGLVLDSSVRVAPPNCTVLHLTTTTSAKGDETTLTRAVEELLSQETTNAKELYHVCFSYPLFDDEQDNSDGVENLHIIPSVGQTLCADDSFVLARQLFEKICPGIEFLERSEQMEETIAQNRFVSEGEDEEREVLDQAAATFLDEKKELENETTQEGKEQEANS